jgi:GNAT superfamily N-acetyltransferase
MITYVETAAGIRPEQLRGFFGHWSTQPSPEDHLRLLLASDLVVLALDASTDAVVGNITAITDGVSCAYIPHLEVLPAYQGRGIGSELVRRMLTRLDHLYMVDLVCDPELQPFYARLGLRPAPAMILRRYERQTLRPPGA